MDEERLKGIKERWHTLREAKPGTLILMDNNPYIVEQAISDTEFLLEENALLRSALEKARGNFKKLSGPCGNFENIMAIAREALAAIDEVLEGK